MRSWLGSTLLVVTALTFGCSRREEQRPRITSDGTVAVSHDGKANEAAAQGTVPSPGKQSSRKRALLIGCTTYDNLPERCYLKGPVNDVELMRKVLTERFGFADKDVVTLADLPKAAGRPTRANIKSHFDRLAKESRPGDHVMILLSGHGSQQPDHEPLDEPDGLDETFVPCDAGPWDAAKKMLVNAILDDELEIWSKAIADSGAALFLIFDCCHSGTMMRGGHEVLREIPEGEVVPREVLQKAREEAAARCGAARGTAALAAPDKPANKTPRLVALYAAQPHEPTIELPMPPDSPPLASRPPATVFSPTPYASYSLSLRRP